MHRRSCLVFILLLAALLVVAPEALGAVSITGFLVEAGDDEIFVRWETASEIDNLGFYVWRSQTEDSGYVKVPLSLPSEQFIPSTDEFGVGALYEFVDVQVTPGIRYYYKVQDVPAAGDGTMVGPESAMIAYAPVVACTLEITTTDRAPFNNLTIETAASIANYTDQSLLVGVGPYDAGASVPTRSDFYRLDNALPGYRYTVQAKPDRTTNYNLGMVVYNSAKAAIITDTNTDDNNNASVTVIADYGPYYFEVFQISDQCSGSTYSLILGSQPPGPNHFVYLPIALRGAAPPPLEVGQRVAFSGAWYDVPMEATVRGSEWRTVLYDDGQPIEADGTFVTALLDVTNLGSRSDEVGQHTSLKLQDGSGRIYDLASVAVHQAAEDLYGRESLYYPIQPGITVPLVLVFDVAPSAQDLRLVPAMP